MTPSEYGTKSVKGLTSMKLVKDSFCIVDPNVNVDSYICY